MVPGISVDQSSFVRHAKVRARCSAREAACASHRNVPIAVAAVAVAHRARCVRVRALCQRLRTSKFAFQRESIPARAYAFPAKDKADGWAHHRVTCTSSPTLDHTSTLRARATTFM